MSVPALTIDGRDADVALGRAIQSADLALTVEAASTLTLTIADQPRALLASGVLDHDDNGKLDHAVDITFDGAVYRLGQITKSGDAFTLIHGDRVVEILKSQRGQVKTTSGGEGHVALARRLVLAAGGRFITPTKAALPSPASAGKHKAAVARADETREKGIADGARLTVKGKAATASQKAIGHTILSVANRLNAGPRATLAMVMAAIVENEMSNSNVINDPGSTSVGVFQAQFGLSAGPRGTITRAQAIDVAYMAEAFLKDPGFASKGGAISIAKAHPEYTPGIIAAEVEQPAAQYRGRYDQVAAEARRWVEAYGGVSGTETSDPASTTRGTADDPDEDSWAALQRVARVKGYRCFAFRGDVYYAREQDLILSRPRLTLSEDTPGVDWIDWEWSPRKKVNVTSVACRASMWAAPPGSVVVLEDCGPADGRWLVSSFSRPVFSPDAMVELRRGTELLKPEPVVEDAARTVSGRVAMATGTSGPTAGISGTPKQIIDTIALPIARANGINATAASVEAANGRHSPLTSSGKPSDHKGPAAQAWAADMSNGGSPTAQMDALAAALAERFGIPWTGAGLVNHTAGGYRYQLIYRYDGHYDHVHLGIRRV